MSSTTRPNSRWQWIVTLGYTTRGRPQIPFSVTILVEADEWIGREERVRRAMGLVKYIQPQGESWLFVAVVRVAGA